MSAHREAAGTGKQSAASQIPHKFHLIWYGGEMPKEFNEYATGWMDNHPDWEFMLWNEGNTPTLINQDLFDRADEIAPIRAGQLRADIARYELLWALGGVYIDVDFECKKPITPLLGEIECFAAYEEQDRWINNAIMGCVPQHPLLEKLIEGLSDNVERHKGYKPNVLSGPQYLTRVINEGNFDINIFPEKWFYPYSYSELYRKDEEFPWAVAVHHWNNKRHGR